MPRMGTGMYLDTNKSLIYKDNQWSCPIIPDTNTWNFLKVLPHLKIKKEPFMEGKPKMKFQTTEKAGRQRRLLFLFFSEKEITP